MSRSRLPAGTRWVWAVAGGSALVIMLSFAAGTLVRSPWEEAVDNSQRRPVVTAEVERRILLPEAAPAQGTFSAGATVDVTLPEQDKRIVTRQLKQAGDVLRSGEALAEVSGRPVIALTLPFELYRDILPGSTGSDVRAVQDALRELGMYTGASDGTYGAATAAAVEALYAGAGFPSPVAAPELLEAVEAAREAVSGGGTTEGVGRPETENAEGTSGSPEPAAPDARKRSAQALADAKAAAMTPLPATDVVALPQAETTIVATAPVGADLGDEGVVVARLRTGVPTVLTRVGASQVSAFTTGTSVMVTSVTDAQVSAEAVVTAVSDFRPPDGTTALPGYDVTVTFADADLAFTDATTVTVVSGSDPAPVAEGLAVPILAIREGPDGTYVTSQDGAVIAVEIVGTGDGLAVVAADGLAEGDRVIVSGEPDHLAGQRS
ncbi:peptidoglycan-binding protein [Oerskovia turbata]|nr:peptidoglycan-binding protein [Oerskovia turbata]